MTYSSRIWLISRGAGNFFLPWVAPFSSCTSSLMMSLQRSTHSSQTNTEGPAISLRTSCWLLPQNEQYSNLPLSSPLLNRSSDIKLPLKFAAGSVSRDRKLGNSIASWQTLEDVLPCHRQKARL